MEWIIDGLLTCVHCNLNYDECISLLESNDFFIKLKEDEFMLKLFLFFRYNEQKQKTIG